MKTSMEGCPILLFCSTFLFTLVICNAVVDSLTTTRSIKDGESIVSAGGSFELGFFKPGNSTKRYLGIWLKKISNGTVVWVANREIPLVDSSGVLKVTDRGILVLLNHNKTIIWSSNSSRLVKNPVAQLLESGNLVMKDGNDDNPENFLWQSFDYPSDTLLGGMKLGRNTVTGLDRYLSSSKSSDDPSPGNFTYQLDPNGYPQFFIRQGSVDLFRSGPWNGLRYSGRPDMKPSPYSNFTFVLTQKEMYFIYENYNSSVVTRLVLNQNGMLDRFIWFYQANSWFRQIVPFNKCDRYALCGWYGTCIASNSSEYCECLEGFMPKFPKDWAESNWSNGCVRRKPLDCRSGDGFKQYFGIKLPDTRHSWFNESMTLEECRIECLKKCTCMAYANLDIREEGSGCLLWFGDLIDIRMYTEDGQDIYIRMASSETAASNLGKVGSNGKKRESIIISLVLAGIVFLCLGLVLYIWKKKKKQLSRQGKRGHNPERGYTTETPKEDLELPLFDFSTVANATDNFSIGNKLGEGGFGPVYKGVMEEGQEIAVKRLSKSSNQGIDEFMNEVLCIAKLQHRNLVKLLGCCIEEGKMLIYEYMPNKSLDFFIFDQSRSILLNWHKRFDIISGIARGLLYLHQDSRLRIIHRDLKASNILLDSEMNPKISDFGMARCFRGNETEANTSRVVGTYGYMSPEYVIDGLFSPKSDVFSFGVLVLEIVSGKRNRGFHHADHQLNLLGHAWRLHREDKALELIDASVRDSCNLTEALRSIQVGLLCVQRFPEDRPSMSSVVVMLFSESALPQPKPPGFFTERNPLDADSSSSKHEVSSSTNEMTITMLQAR